ncbi:MAG: bifunctional DNA-formamidopyrimidine glycosylase/DNA-(apurinic or apyrimidinic site) lyase [Pyrinomonadaceae bacterium]|nr:bifunctional DNA-formamidopyrimidine glycosylase/DNA-(apurinic or apyrimidinic site) lyase [Pyrinomonadaceae bacterium]
MPELPEVELVVQGLAQLLKGRSIRSGALYREKLAPGVSPQKFERTFHQRDIIAITRRGKHILFELSGGKTLITHLRMSGTFQVLQPRHENPKFTHAEFILDNDDRLVFSDQRHFGYMNIVESDELGHAPELNKLAPEPFSSDFSRPYLAKVLKSSRRKIKEFLLDQTKVCGLGNIYASEALYLSRVHPLKPSCEISTIKANRLHASIIKVLSDSLDFGAGMEIDPLNLDSRYFGGDYEGEWYVYDREGLPCRRCEAPIRRIIQGSRSSYFCSRCQRK